MANNQPTDSTVPSNTAIKPEDSVTILFHGVIPPMQVLTNVSAAVTCEEVLVKCIAHIQNRVVCAQGANNELHGLKYLPTFGLLVLPEKEIWLPLNHVFSLKTSSENLRKYMFRVRFRPPVDKFRGDNNNVMCEYLFLQILDDFLKGSLGKSVRLDKEKLFGLLQIALMIPPTLPLNSAEEVDATFKSRTLYIWNFTKHFSKAIAKRLMSVPIMDHYWVYKTLTAEINKYKTHIPAATLGFYKNEFYRLLMEAVPDYCFEVYKATEVKLNTMKKDELVSANIGLYKESGKHEALYYGEEFQCSLKDIYSMKIEKPKDLSVKKWTVLIDLISETPKILSFSEEGAAESFVSMIQGYFRLCLYYNMCLCDELQTSHSKISNELSSFGPIRKTIADTYLEQSKNTTESNNGAFLIHESLDQFGQYEVKVRPKSNAHDNHKGSSVSRNSLSSGVIQCLSDTQLRLKLGDEEFVFANCRQLRNHLKSKFGSQVLPLWENSLKSSESVVPFRLNCCEVKKLRAQSECLFQSVADISEEFQDLKLEYYGAHTSNVFAQSSSIALPVVKEDLTIISSIPDKNPLIKKYVVSYNEEKMMLLELQSDEGVYAKAFREGLRKLLKLYRIKKKSFLKFYSLVLDPQFSVLMEYVPHQDVLTYICKNPLKVIQKVDIMDQIVKILIVMEQNNFYHGNFRLRKFMAFDSQDAELVTVKLGDPGIVSHFDTLEMSDLNNDERAPWLSPERRSNLTTITYKSEVYALGTTLYELLCRNDQFREELKLRENELMLTYLENNKHLPCPPLLDNSQGTSSEEDEGNKLVPEAVHVLRMVWEDVILKCWAEDEADRPSVQTLLVGMKAVREAAGTIEADTVIDKMKQVAYDFGMERKDMKTDDNKELTIQELRKKFQAYVFKHYLHEDCLDMQGYTSKLGTGHFGTVYKGLMRAPQKNLLPQNPGHKSKKLAEQNSINWIPVAVKRIKHINGWDRKSLYKEVNTACDLNHPNVVKLLHLCETFAEIPNQRVAINFDPLMMVMEFMNEGNLTKYSDKYGDLSDRGRVSHMLKILLDVAEGMVYLSGKEIVHRDLAARNVLLTRVDGDGSNVIAKVSDFGLARMMEENYRFYKVKPTEELPIVWTPPECFVLEEAVGKFSSKGDVWSFGIVMWEAFSRGATPWKILQRNITPVELLEKYRSNWRLPPPKNKYNTKEIYSVMTRCWEMDPSRRPAFVELVQILKNLI